jgi:hypothetical protein
MVPSTPNIMNSPSWSSDQLALISTLWKCHILSVTLTVCWIVVILTPCHSYWQHNCEAKENNDSNEHQGDFSCVHEESISSKLFFRDIFIPLRSLKPRHAIGVQSSCQLTWGTSVWLIHCWYLPPRMGKSWIGWVFGNCNFYHPIEPCVSRALEIGS